MPKIAVYKAFTFLIVMFDTLGEPPHLHIVKSKSYGLMAKIWLESLTFAETGDFTEKELNTIEKLVAKNQARLIEHFERVRNGERVKPIKL